MKLVSNKHTHLKSVPWYKSIWNLRYARKFARKAKKAIQTTMNGFGQEAVETKEMANMFFRLLESKLDMESRKEPPTHAEVEAALEQLKDVARISIFASISLLPGGGFSLVGLEILARKFGIKNFTFIPSAFRDKDNPDLHISTDANYTDNEKTSSSRKIVG